MSLFLVAQAMEALLATVSTGVETANENQSYAPKTGVPYQQIYLIPAEPSNPSMGSNFYREQGIFQVTLRYPFGAGSGAALTQAELIKATFRRGMSMVAGGQITIVDRTPAIMPHVIDGDRYCLSVRVRFYADIYV